MLFSYKEKNYDKEEMVLEQRRMFFFIHIFCFVIQMIDVILLIVDYIGVRKAGFDKPDPNSLLASFCLGNGDHIMVNGKKVYTDKKGWYVSLSLVRNTLVTLML